MINKKSEFIFIFFIVITFAFCGCINDNLKTKSLTVDASGSADFVSIRDAINNSSDGYTIYVNSGTYHESISIIKSINIYGSDPKTTIITGKEKNPGSNILNINIDNCSLSGFTIINSFNSPGLTGIKISSNNNIIENNIIIDAQVGIYISNYGANNIIKGNIILNNTNGISIFSSINNHILDNIILNNSDSGIRLKDSSLNVIFRNLIMSNEKGLYICCESRNNICYNNIFEKNIEEHVKGSASNIWDNSGIGNYWDDYSGKDLDLNGIGDESYSIEGEVSFDYYPLINKPNIYNDIYQFSK